MKTQRREFLKQAGVAGAVIAGYPKDKQVWLKAGDKLVTTIEKLGELRFSLV